MPRRWLRKASTWSILSSHSAIARGGVSSPSGKGLEWRRVPGNPFAAFVLPEGRLNSVLVHYLSKNNLGELLKPAETLASQKEPRY